MRFRTISQACALLSLATAPAFATTTTNLYVADYGTGDLLRYTATLVGSTEVLTQATPVQTILPPTGGAITEGINGTSDDILTIVRTGSGSYEIARYTDSGSFIGYVGGGATTFAGVGSFAVTSNAQYMYVADQSGNELYKVSLATGLVVDKVSINQVHDVTILSNGNVIAEDLNGGIVEYDANLDASSETTFVAQGTNNQAEPATGAGNLQGHNQYGLAIDPNASSLYYNDVFTISDDRSGGPGDSTGESGTVYVFTQSGTYVTSWTPTQGSNFEVGTFGISFGPDGNLYSANLGGVVLGDNAGNQVGQMTINMSTASFATYIAGDTSGTVNPATGLSAPKYLNWQTDFSPSADPGFVPEPSGKTIGTAFVVMLGLLIFRGRRRNRRATLAV